MVVSIRLNQFATANIHMNRITPILPGLVLLATLTTPLFAQNDSVVGKDGKEQKGTITKYIADKKQIEFDSENIKVPYTVDTFNSINLAPRPEYKTALTDIKAKKFQEAVDLLQPLVTNYLGIPNSPGTSWVVDAALNLAAALNGAGKRQEALDMYDRISKAYPGGIASLLGDIGKARDLIGRKVWADALDLVAKVEAKLPDDAKTPVPAPLTREILGDIYFIRGTAYEGQSKKQEALTAYLKVVTLYMEPEEQAKEAQERADRLRKEDPKLRVE